MKKIFLLLTIYLFLNSIAHAANTIYLKCPKIITDNKSSNSPMDAEPDLDDWAFNVEKKINTMFTKIKLGKSKSTFTPYHYEVFGALTLLMDKKSLGKPMSAKLWWIEGDKKTFKVKKDKKDNYVIDQSNKLMGLPTDQTNIMQKMIWYKQAEDWFYKEVMIIKVNEGESESKIITESICDIISKKEFKNYIENGEGLDFYN